jgi:hypothetical protein
MSDGTNQNSNPGGNGAENSGGSGEKGGTVSYETYVKSVDAEKSLRKQLAEATARLSKFDEDVKNAEEQKKIAADQHLEVIAGLKKDLEAATAKNGELNNQISDFRKTSLVMSAFAQKGLQVDSKYAHLIDLESIDFDAEGKPVMASVMKVVDAFQKDHPVLAQPKKGGMPGGQTAANGSGPLTKEQWAKLPLAEQKARWKDVKV